MLIEESDKAVTEPRQITQEMIRAKLFAKAKSEVPEGYTPELRGFAQELCTEDLESLKTGVVLTRAEAKVDLTIVREERREAVKPFDEKIKGLKLLIENCDKKLGIEPKPKRASRVQTLTFETLQLREQVKALSAALTSK